LITTAKEQPLKASPTPSSLQTATKIKTDYRALFLSSPIPSFVLKNIDGDLFLIDFNQAATETINNISSNFLKRSITDIFSDWPELNTDFLTSFAEKSSSAREVRYRPDIRKPHLHLNFRSTFLAPDLLVVHIEDIHHRRQAESALRKNKERLELAISATDAGLWDWHIPSGEVIFGEQWAAILGYTLDEIDPNISSWEKLIHPDDKSRVMDRLNRHMAGESPRYQSEHRLLGKNGNWVWVLDVGKVVERDANNAPVRMAGTKVDISRRKKMEADLELLNEELEKRIEKRTRKLKQSEQSLIRSQKDLRSKSEHLTEVNNALKILLKKSDENKKEIEENVLANVTELIVPYLDKIEEKKLIEAQKVYMRIIRSNLDEIVSSFSRKLTSKYLNLTHAEITVANLIKQGKTTKEIASLLYLSSKTIETQRRNIRKKIGINRKKINLRTYLHAVIE
jgi:PAS domain S-box-containing protein